MPSKLICILLLVLPCLSYAQDSSRYRWAAFSQGLLLSSSVGSYKEWLKARHPVSELEFYPVDAHAADAHWAAKKQLLDPRLSYDYEGSSSYAFEVWREKIPKPKWRYSFGIIYDVSQKEWWEYRVVFDNAQGMDSTNIYNLTWTSESCG